MKQKMLHYLPTIFARIRVCRDREGIINVLYVFFCHFFVKYTYVRLFVYFLVIFFNNIRYNMCKKIITLKVITRHMQNKIAILVPFLFLKNV